MIQAQHHECHYLTQPELLDITIVSTAKDWGGGEEQARLLAHGLQRLGHRCRTLARAGSALAERLTDECLPVTTFNGKGFRAGLQIRRLLSRQPPQVLHFNDPHALALGGPAAAGLRISVRIAARKTAYPIRSAVPYRRWCDRVIGVSNAVIDRCLAAGIPNERLHLVYDGADPKRVSDGRRERGRQILGIHPDETLLLSIGSLLTCKGHAQLLQALPRVLARFPQARFALVGEGRLRRKLEQLAATLELTRQVRFLGFRHDVADLLQAADLFILPSIEEGLCSTLIEALFARRPVVTTTAGGIPEVIGATDLDASTIAWIVPPGDPRSLADAILTALAAPQEYAERLRRGYDRATRLFHADRMVAATLEIYQEVLSARPRQDRSQSLRGTRTRPFADIRTSA